MTVWWQFCSWSTEKAILWHFVLGKRTKQFCGTVLRILSEWFRCFQTLHWQFLPDSYRQVLWMTILFTVISTLHNAFSIVCQHMLFRPQSCGIYHCFKRLMPSDTIFYASESKKPAQSPPGPFSSSDLSCLRCPSWGSGRFVITGARGEIGRQWRLDLRSASLQPGTGANCSHLCKAYALTPLHAWVVPLQQPATNWSPETQRTAGFHAVTLRGKDNRLLVLHCHTENRLLVLHCHTENRLLVLHCHTVTLLQQTAGSALLHCHVAATDCWFCTVTLGQRTADSTLSHCEVKTTDCWFYTVTLLQRTACSALPH